MPRVLKNTRIKGVPPKVQLRNNEAATGSFPTKPRISSDNRRGNYAISYNDENTIFFQTKSGSATDGLSLPIGLPVSNSIFYVTDQTGSVIRNTEMLSDILVRGDVRKGVGDHFIKLTSPGQEMQPFFDESKPAVDGLSEANSFFVSGSRISDIGDGFQQPLWSKTKIEIDLTPSANHSFYIENYTSGTNNYPMAYWNKDNHVWEGVGSGKEFGLYTASAESSFTSICEDQCIGFGYGMNQGGSSVRDLSAGAKISNFGFPFHVKYHGTSSNLIKMSEYISAPFLLEKIVLEWSGALAYNNTYDKTVTTFAASTFFILNQRKPYGFNNSSVQRFVYKLSDQHTGYVTSGAFIPGAYNGGDEVNTVRELVTFSQVMGFSNAAGTTTKQRAARELNLTSTDGSWSGRFIMSGTVKTAFPTEGLSEFKIGHNDLGFLSMMLINQNSTRTGLFTPGGRDFVGALENGNRVASSIALLSNYPLTTEPTGVIVTIDRYSKPNPYLLQPSDELIFGWQLPVSNMVNSSNNTGQYAGKGPELFFDNVPSKITFYGSMISENKEVHDTLNQLLSSVTIHEEIG